MPGFGDACTICVLPISVFVYMIIIIYAILLLLILRVSVDGIFVTEQQRDSFDISGFGPAYKTFVCSRIELLEIVREQQRDAKKGGMSGFDPACTMFVCNKWDIVEDREGRQPGTEKKVWEDTLNKLEKYFPNYNPDLVYKMYTTQARGIARRYQANKMGRTEKLKRLMEGFEQLVPASLLGKITKHYRWLDKLLERLQSFVATRINRARDSDEEKQRLHDTVTKRLNTLSMDAGKIIWLKALK
ncbi:hypothetical protein MAR_038253 [Mya arenaria]|uniref:Uncharacterized protein n=1 Tax=Mya arenaria TaxID=6604 RepID=A0ABY7FTG4_MYAAR|nr:hypothetical protein MAR_038253 [Mya arenaria]